MDDTEAGFAGVEPVAPGRDEAGRVIAHMVEQAKRVRRELSRHGRYSRLAEVFLAGGADADAGGPDPVGDAAALNQGGGDFVEVAGQTVGDIDEAEVGLVGHITQLVGAGVDDGVPVVAPRMPHDETVHRHALIIYPSRVGQGGLYIQ